MASKILKYTIRIIIGIIVLMIGYVAVATVLSVVTTHPEPIECKEKQEIYIIANKVHLNIAVPTNVISDSILTKLQVPKDSVYLIVGWGDKAFYINTPTWNDMKLSTAIRALFLNSESAMHVEYSNKKTNRWVTVKLCDVQYHNLMQYIMHSFEQDATGAVIEIEGAGYTNNDKFYEAKGNYTVFYTCNDWVNQALKKAEVKTAVWSPFTYGVLRNVIKNKSTSNN